MQTDSYNPSQRISLSLSIEAYSTIQSDMDVFQNKPNFDGFINRVISNFKDTSDASISLALEREREKYYTRLSSRDQANKEEVKCIERLLSGYRDDLIKRMNSFPNGVIKKPRINNDNYSSLEMGSNRFQEFDYYPREGRYIKALLEDYSRLPFFEREGIYYGDIISNIDYAISGHYIITLDYTNRKQEKKRLSLRPYKIVSSSLLRYHYLLALSVDRQESPRITSLRISRISKAIPLKRTSHITKQEAAYIESEIQSKGIQYLVGQNNRYEVLFTEHGYALYNSILYLRPKAIEESICDDGNIKMIFDCSEEQIKNYFLQFGKEAVISKPKNASDWFKTYYYNAYMTYKNI